MFNGFRKEVFEVEIDGVKIMQNENVETTMVMINNGKFSQGGMINPFAAVNDGLLDISWIQDPKWMGVFGVSGILNEAKSKAGT